MKKVLISLAAGCVGLVAVNVASAESLVHQAQALRQSAMTLIANDFGYMHAMTAGKIPWNEAQFMERGHELGALGQLDLLRGFIPGSFQGHTHAKPEIELNRDDFNSRMHKLEKDLRAIGSAPDAQAMKVRFKDLAHDCRSCHKKYKSREMIGG